MLETNMSLLQWIAEVLIASLMALMCIYMSSLQYAQFKATFDLTHLELGVDAKPFNPTQTNKIVYLCIRIVVIGK